MNRNKLTAAFLLASSLALGGCNNETSAPVDIKEKEAHWGVIYQKVADGASKTELDILSDARFGSSSRHFAHIEDCRFKHLGGTDIKTDFNTAKQITLCAVEQARATNREVLHKSLGAGSAGVIGIITALQLYRIGRKEPKTTALKN